MRSNKTPPKRTTDLPNIYEFRIRWPNGEEIRFDKLDREAAELWGVEMHPEKWATPPPAEIREMSWYDAIGSAITTPMLFRKHTMQQSWEDVKQTMLNEAIQNTTDQPFEEMVMEIELRIRNLKPFFELIDHWESKSYIPVKIK